MQMTVTLRERCPMNRRSRLSEQDESGLFGLPENVDAIIQMLHLLLQPGCFLRSLFARYLNFAISCARVNLSGKHVDLLRSTIDSILSPENAMSNLRSARQAIQSEL